MIVCCGESLIDMVPSEDGSSFEARPGGCPYNSAIAAGRLGASVSFLGRMGKDFFGDLLFDRLKANGVDDRYIVRGNDPATLAFVKKEKSGDVRYAFYSNGAADRSLVPEDLPAEFGPEVGFLMLGSISMILEPTASTIEFLAAREAGKRLVSFDPNIRPSLIADRTAYLSRFERWTALSSIVKVSSDDLEWLYPGMDEDQCIDRLLGFGPVLVVVTRGGKGSIARTARVETTAPSFDIKIVDTIGAGDTFHAALLYRLDKAGVTTREKLAALDEPFLHDVIVFANGAAALDCTKKGAEPPTLAELEKFGVRSSR
jgi:fructokinase